MTCDSRGSTNGINEAILTELAAEFVSQGVDFVLFPGDLISGMRVSSNEFEAFLRRWVEIMGPVYDANIAVYVGRGNHEIFDNYHTYPPPTPLDPNETFAGRWLKVFGSDSDPNQKLPDNGPAGEQYMTYSLIHKNAFIAMLDQYAGAGHWLSHKVNQPWLDAQLTANTKPHVFIAGHQPAFKAKDRAGLDDYPPKRDALWAAIANNSGRTYFCGHDHFFNHARVDDGDGDPNNDVHQYIVGTAGPLYTWNSIYPGDNSHYTVESLYHARRNGYVLVEVDSLNVTLTWMQRHTTDTRITGIYEPNDTWSYTAVPKPIVLSPNGGESLAATNTFAITWKTLEGAEIDPVKIDYSPDNGQTWQEIDICPNTGSHQWDLPLADSNQCLVRISDPANSAAGDTSDATFTIFQCQQELPADFNRDCYVDFLDFVILAADPTTDFLDFAALAADWLTCANPYDPVCNLQR
ncbi:MAG: metallophosphoesterase [Planctomycetes bacterium]|nr:metallophosphoesterase [Planctomycetota bacterium]